MTYEETLKELKEGLNSQELRSEFHEGFVNFSKRTIDGIEKDIEKATSGEEVKPEEKLAEEIFAVLSDSVNMVVGKTLSDKSKAFVYAYAGLAMNWNQIGGSTRITETVSTLIKLEDMRNSFTALIETSRRLSKRMTDLEQRRPAYYELSQHYLKAIKTSLDKE